MKESHSTITGRWFLRLFAWDGLLPLSIWAIPFCLGRLFPGKVGLIELAAIILPVTAFWIRYLVGMKAIRENDCGPRLKKIQKCAFCMAIFVLVLFESMLILFQDFANVRGINLPGQSVAELIVPYSVYLLTMAFAMYPGFDNLLERESKLMLKQIADNNWYHRDPD